MVSLRNKLLKHQAEMHLSENIVEWRPLRNGGSLNISFFGMTESGLSFTAKYNLICKTTLQQRKIRKTVDEKTDSIFPKLICSYVSFPFHICFISEWIEGVSLNLQSLNDDPQCLYECAYIVSKKLKTMHTIENHYQFSSRSLKEDYRKALREIKFYKIDVPHLAEFIKYVDNNISEITHATQGYVHFDFHPGNIIKQDHDYRIIDLETICVSEPWRDLVYATEINFPEQHKFWVLFLIEYFDGKIPDEYFIHSKLYVIIYMLMLAKYNKNNSLEMYFNLVNKVYEDYNELRSNIPNWIIETAKELYENTIFLKDALRDLIKFGNGSSGHDDIDTNNSNNH